MCCPKIGHCGRAEPPDQLRAIDFLSEGVLYRRKMGKMAVGRKLGAIEYPLRRVEHERLRIGSRPQPLRIAQLTPSYSAFVALVG